MVVVLEALEFIKKLETELKIRGFSQETVKSYSYHNSRFLIFLGKQPDLAQEDDVKLFLANLIADKSLSPASVALARSAILFGQNQILKKSITGIKTPKIQRKNPAILSKDEIKELIKVCKNQKSALLIKFLYSSGLRVSECLNLKLEDIDFEEGICNVVQGKGKKDRITIISNKLLDELKDYCLKNSISEGFIFINIDGKPIGVRNVQKIISLSAKRAGIKKQVTPHKLRHSFATHLLEAGVSIRIIQELLGHSNLQTTQIYTRVSRENIKGIRSPFDDL